MILNHIAHHEVRYLTEAAGIHILNPLLNRPLAHFTCCGFVETPVQLWETDLSVTLPVGISVRCTQSSARLAAVGQTQQNLSKGLCIVETHSGIQAVVCLY